MAAVNNLISRQIYPSQHQHELSLKAYKEVADSLDMAHDCVDLDEGGLHNGKLHVFSYKSQLKTGRTLIYCGGNTETFSEHIQAKKRLEQLRTLGEFDHIIFYAYPKRHLARRPISTLENEVYRPSHGDLLVDRNDNEIGTVGKRGDILLRKDNDGYYFYAVCSDQSEHILARIETTQLPATLHDKNQAFAGHQVIDAEGNIRGYVIDGKYYGAYIAPCPDNHARCIRFIGNAYAARKSTQEPFEQQEVGEKELTVSAYQKTDLPIQSQQELTNSAVAHALQQFSQKNSAELTLYGHSLGGYVAIQLAKELQEKNISANLVLDKTFSSTDKFVRALFSPNNFAHFYTNNTKTRKQIKILCTILYPFFFILLLSVYLLKKTNANFKMRNSTLVKSVPKDNILIIDSQNDSMMRGSSLGQGRQMQQYEKCQSTLDHAPEVDDKSATADLNRYALFHAKKAKHVSREDAASETCSTASGSDPSLSEFSA